MNQIANLTNPGELPAHGDMVREQRSNGAVIERMWIEPELVLPVLTHLDFLRLLRPDQVGRWRRRVKAALEADPVTEMDDVIVAADQHFAAAKAVDMQHEETQAALYIMYSEGAFGPFFDGTGTPSPEQLDAMNEADRVARAEWP